MHPGMFAWWKHAERFAHHHGCGASAGCGAGGDTSAFDPEVFAHGDHFENDFSGGHFGVRRPLRFLAQKLDLSEKQVTELAQILNELKTERAQAAVDHRRTVSGFADAIEAETFDAEKAASAAGNRVESADRLRTAVVKALGRIHALLGPEQRRKFAYLVRTGALSL